MLSGHALQMTPGGENTELSPFCLPIHNETGFFLVTLKTEELTGTEGSVVLFVSFTQVWPRSKSL